MKRGSHTFALLIIMFSILNFSSLLSAGNIPDLPPTDQDPCTFGDGNIGPCIPENDFILNSTGLDSNKKCVWTWCGPDTVEECVDPRLDTSTCVSKTNKGNCKCGGPGMGGGGCKNSKNELCDPTSGDPDCTCTNDGSDEELNTEDDSNRDDAKSEVGTFSLTDFAIEDDTMKELRSAVENISSDIVMGANGNGEVFAVHFSLEADTVKFATQKEPGQDEENEEEIANTGGSSIEGGPEGDFCVAMAQADIDKICEKEDIEMQFLCISDGYAFGGRPLALINEKCSLSALELTIFSDIYTAKLDEDISSLSKLATKYANTATIESIEPIYAGSFELVYNIAPEEFQLVTDNTKFNEVSTLFDNLFPIASVPQLTEAEAGAGDGITTATATSCRSSALTADQNNPRASQSTLLILLLIILSILRFHHKK